MDVLHLLYHMSVKLIRVKWLLEANENIKQRKFLSNTKPRGAPCECNKLEKQKLEVNWAKKKSLNHTDLFIQTVTDTARKRRS